VITAVQQVRFAHPMIVVVDEELRQWSAPTPVSSNSEEFVSLELREICFSHSGRDQAVLEKLDLLLQRGERIGVMGESGAGKSTLIDVLLGLHVPDSGNILLNGKPLASDLSRLHQVVGYVPQAVFLSDASIRENVAFGLAAEDINSDLVWSALRLAQLQEFVDDLPEKLDTVVGERGVRLSGGQRQRIGIARALYRMPQVLIFDEATSSLDMATESSFLDSVEELGKSHTLLMVAHRNSTLKNCDRIFRLEGGRLQLMSG
jgi:ABC-type multidrug transport system fused ATPase/permease subunit